MKTKDTPLNLHEYPTQGVGVRLIGVHEYDASGFMTRQPNKSLPSKTTEAAQLDGFVSPSTHG